MLRRKRRFDAAPPRSAVGRRATPLRHRPADFGPYRRSTARIYRFFLVFRVFGPNPPFPRRLCAFTEFFMYAHARSSDFFYFLIGREAL
jgi:hypothetical protein